MQATEAGRKLMEPLKRTLENPYLHLAIGLLLFATSLADA